MRPWKVAIVLLLPVVATATPPPRIDTDKHAVAVGTVVDGLKSPWGLALLPGGDILLTEKPGTLRLLRAGKPPALTVEGTPAVAVKGQGGLLDVAVHPQFERNRLVFLSYAAAASPTDQRSGTEVARARLDCGASACRLQDLRVLFRQQPKFGTGVHFGSRLVFSREGLLYVTLGERGQQDLAQGLDNHLGKVLRIDVDGRAAPGNPFLQRAGALPEIFSYGHRNVQGAALHPVTGELWAHEHGPQGGDELNIVRIGRNYGWPVITFGRTYGKGEQIGEGTERADVAKAVRTWVPSVAPSGLAFYRGTAFPGWQGSLFMGTLREQRLIRLSLDGERVTGEERIAGFGRIRSVAVDPEGQVLVLSEGDGALYRLSPVKVP